MVLSLKFHLHTHQLSSIPLTNLVHKTRTPLFQVQPIQTCGFSPLHLKSETNRFKASDLEGSNGNGGGGGGVKDRRKGRGGGDDDDEDGVGYAYGYGLVRLCFRWAEFLLGLGGGNVGAVAVGLPANLAWLCVQVTWQLHLALLGICYAFVACTFAGVFVISIIVTSLFLHFF